MKTKSVLIAMTVFLGISMTSFAEAESSGKDFPPVQTVSSVDLTRYQGTWYQIAYIPTFFQKGCEVNVTAKYTVRDDGNVAVENQCFKENGTRKSITGYAYSVDAPANSKLKVKFFWFAPAGDYWVMDLGSNYEYAVVGTPNRKYLWILSRAPQMATVQYQSLLKKIEDQHYDLSQIKITAALTEVQP
jgi:apolipoprotein D and lipocalin family protein